MIQKTETEVMQNWQDDPDHPLVSIRCTAYNHEKYIAQCLDGFLMQETTFPFEIVIHDDASTDRTANIIREYGKRFPTIICPIYETENQYSKKDGSLRRIMTAHCRGKYLAMCEGDDYWISPLKLQKQVSFLESHSAYSMVFHAADYILGNKIVNNDQRSPIECDYTTDDIIHGGGDFCATASLCMRTEMFTSRYEFQNHADVGDFPLQIAMSLKGKVHYDPDTMAVYRLSEGNDDSWTSRVLHARQGKIDHNRNEISWLKELDDFTDYRFHASIQYRIALMSINLLIEEDMSPKEAMIIARKLKGEDRKEIMTSIREIKMQRTKERIKNALPWLYQIYKRREFLSS